MKKDGDDFNNKASYSTSTKDISDIEEEIDRCLAKLKRNKDEKGDLPDKSQNNKVRKLLGFRKKVDSVDVVGSDEVFSGIDGEVVEGVDESEVGLVDEKIEAASEVDESVERGNDIAEVKAVELAEKHRFFKGLKKISEVETKEVGGDGLSDVASPLADDLIDVEVLPKKKVRKLLGFRKKVDSVDVVGSDEVFSGIDGEVVEGVDESEVGLVDEKIEAASEVDESVERRDNVASPRSDDINDLEKKYEGLFTFSDLTPLGEETDEAKKDEFYFLNKKISETPLSESSKDKKFTFAETELKKPKKKRSFFKRKKASKGKKIKEKEVKIVPTKLKGKLRFRVENLPKPAEINEEAARLLDENIKNASDDNDSIPYEDSAEVKALKLAEEHIKDRPLSTAEEARLSKKSNIKKDGEAVKGISKSVFDTAQDKSDLEHAFFDEPDSSSDGWSPQVIEKEKDGLSPLSEVEPKDIELPKEVLQPKSIKLSDLGFLENDWEELDFYPLQEPFAFVEILREKETLDKRYFLVQVELAEEEQRVLEFITDTLKKITINSMELESEGEDRYLMKKIDQIVDDYDLRIDDESKAKILYYFKGASLGLGKISPLMKDPNIEDISCDGAGVPIFLYHRQYGSLKSNIEFKDEDELSSFVFRLAQKCGKHISIAEPMLDATMPDGSRIQMTLSDEVTSKGSTFTIRKFREDPFSPPDLVEFNTMSAEMVAYMWLAVENGINALIAGGTASGKTTALNALSLFIPREAKIVSIEETREINLPHPNWIPGVSRSGFGEIVADKVVGEIDLYDLMKAALRQRPEYILVGEIRGREAYVLFQAMATGHATFSTVHADSAQSLIHRLEGKPINIPRVMLQSLDIITLHIITRVKNKRARRCKQIIEIIDIDPTTKEILTNEVFRWDPVEDKFVYSGKSYVLERIRAEKDLSREKMTEEIKNRAEIIEWMNKNNIRQFREVAKIVTQYIEAPLDLLESIKEAVIS